MTKIYLVNNKKPSGGKSRENATIESLIELIRIWAESLSLSAVVYGKIDDIHLILRRFLQACISSMTMSFILRRFRFFFMLVFD